MSSRLDELRATGTVVIADTADFQKIAAFRPSEGTTNPSLIFAAAQNASYEPLLAKTISYIRSLPKETCREEQLSRAVEMLSVQFGKEIYKLTGRISTEVDVSLSFNTAGTVAAALRILELYAAEGIPKDKVRIKISATWEGIQATRILQKEHGASCLVTIVFGSVQAIAAAEAGADAIAPYVGRIADYGKQHGHQGDLVMAASFRNVEQIRALAGIDLLTAAPSILELVEADSRLVVPVLTVESAQAAELQHASYINDESKFRWAFNADALAVEKSAEAMRKFGDDTEKLKSLLSKLLDV
uniref:Transaldolase n=1 Tax=Bionectria ochroleuca TaxID=29856 RepID=A0A8H7NLK2_BIOOC